MSPRIPSLEAAFNGAWVNEFQPAYLQGVAIKIPHFQIILDNFGANFCSPTGRQILWPSGHRTRPEGEELEKVQLDWGYTRLSAKNLHHTIIFDRNTVTRYNVISKL